MKIQIGDAVEFKSDIEQIGKVIHINANGWLIVENKYGFGGAYIGGQTTAHVHTNDVLAHIPAKKTRKATIPAKKTKSLRPKEGTVSAQIWDLAYEYRHFTRTEFLDLCESKGINRATASTQYSKWKKFTD